MIKCVDRFGGVAMICGSRLGKPIGTAVVSTRRRGLWQVNSWVRREDVPVLSSVSQPLFGRESHGCPVFTARHPLDILVMPVMVNSNYHSGSSIFVDQVVMSRKYPTGLPPVGVEVGLDDDRPVGLLKSKLIGGQATFDEAYPAFGPVQ